MPDLFAGATMHWIGANLLGASDSQREAFLRHLDAVELPAGAAASGAGAAYRLDKLVQSPRRAFGPDYLSVYEFARLPAAEHLPQEEVVGPWAPVHEAMWRMSWTLLSDTVATTARPDRVRLLALSPPVDATADEEREWNQFYTEVHVPEAMARRRWSRATRWALDSAQLHPPPGCPRYFVAYEGVGFVDATAAEVAAHGPWTEGPPVWKRQVGAWTLDYRVPPARG